MGFCYSKRDVRRCFALRSDQEKVANPDVGHSFLTAQKRLLTIKENHI